MATSKLQQYLGRQLNKHLPQFAVIENHRPDWLISSDNTRLELDFYIEDLGIAFEVQGLQHYEFINFFYKTEEDFKKRKRHDKEKKDLCFGRGIKLTEILTENDANIAIQDIKAKLARCDDNLPTYSYSYGSQSVQDEIHRLYQNRQKKLKKKAEKKILDKEHIHPKVITPSISINHQPHGKLDQLNELRVWCDVAIRRFKKQQELNFVYMTHYGYFKAEIRKFIELELPFCTSIEQIKDLFSRAVDM